MSFNPIYGEQAPLSGYVGAACIVALSLCLAFGKIDTISLGFMTLLKEEVLFSMMGLSFAAMVCAEWFGRRSYVKRGFIETRAIEKSPNFKFLLKSSAYRFAALFSLFFLAYYTVTHHYYFVREGAFNVTRHFFEILFWIYLIFGFPYILMTLRLRWGRQFEYNDYGILLLIFFKRAFLSLYHWLLKRDALAIKHFSFVSNRRVGKVFLVQLVNFFFLTLMIRFLQGQYGSFEAAARIFISDDFSHMRFFDQYNNIFNIIYNLMFVVDVGIGMMGYAIASRWLDNRTRSVDMTMSGWFVAIVCYPPLNSAFLGSFISYGAMPTHQIVTNETVLMVMKALILCLFFIYVWATVSLGLKFSNLTHRGIVSTGPYAVIRHPAYITKNLAWWLENSYVFSNIWAMAALFAGNMIYVLRALTEERHLKKDPKYKAYCEQVRWRFIPGVI